MGVGSALWRALSPPPGAWRAELGLRGRARQDARPWSTSHQVAEVSRGSEKPTCRLAAQSRSRAQPGSKGVLIGSTCVWVASSLAPGEEPVFSTCGTPHTPRVRKRRCPGARRPGPKAEARPRRHPRVRGSDPVSLCTERRMQCRVRRVLSGQAGRQAYLKPQAEKAGIRALWATQQGCV